MGKNISRPPRTSPPITVSYPTLFTPRTFAPGDIPKYGIVLMLEKTNEEHKALLRAIHQDATEILAEHWPDETKRPRIPIVGHDTSLIKDGDIALNKQGIPMREKNPEYIGHYLIRANTTTKPGVVDRNGQAILDFNEVNGGTICLVNFNVYSYEGQKSSGVTCGLNGVLKWEEGVSFGGGRPSVEEMFGTGDYGADDPMNYNAGGADPFAQAGQPGGTTLPEDGSPF